MISNARALKYNDIVIVEHVRTRQLLVFAPNGGGRALFANVGEPVMLVVRQNGCAEGNSGLRNDVGSSPVHLQVPATGAFLANEQSVACAKGEDAVFQVFVGEGDTTTPTVGSDNVLIQCVDGALFLGAADAGTAKPALFSYEQQRFRLIPAGVADSYVTAAELNKRIGRGINFGNALESGAATIAKNPQGWGSLPITAADIARAKDAKFTSIRLPVRWDDQCVSDQQPWTIKESWFRTVESAVQMILSCNLVAILNIHHFDPLMQNPQAEGPKLLKLWEQVSWRFRAYPSSLVFEVLNEPHANINTVWNSVLDGAVTAIRAHNRTRVLMIGPAGYNSREWLKHLVIPKAVLARTILTFHFYEPFELTHSYVPYQEVPNPRLTWPVPALNEYAAMNAAFEEVANQVKTAFGAAMPVCLGEFGTFTGATNWGVRKDHAIGVVDMASRARWIVAVRGLCARFGYSWCYFDFKSMWAKSTPNVEQMSFGLYDDRTGKWNQQLLSALII